MDASQWPQLQNGGLARTMDEIEAPMGTNTNTNTNTRASRPQKEQNINCPRCNSTNTKFCYYNNYSLTQPRYFCKTCRRYWTQGGSLRNVPVGGGSRKNKRPSSSSPSILSSSSNNASSKLLIPDLNPPNTLPHLINPSNKFLDAQDLNLAFPMQGIFHPNNEGINNISNSTPPPTTTDSAPILALEFLRTGIASRGSLNPYFPMPIPDPNSPLYPSGLPNLQDFKPNVGVFPSSHHGGSNGNSTNDENNGMIGANGARLLFPFADMNKLANSAKVAHHDHHPEIDDQSKEGDHHNHHHHQGPTTGYWTGMLGGGAW